MIAPLVETFWYNQPTESKRTTSRMTKAVARLIRPAPTDVSTGTYKTVNGSTKNVGMHFYILY